MPCFAAAAACVWKATDDAVDDRMLFGMSALRAEHWTGGHRRNVQDPRHYSTAAAAASVATGVLLWSGGSRRIAETYGHPISRLFTRSEFPGVIRVYEAARVA